MADVTAIVITKNEEQNIVDCLDSIKDFAKRILVIDSGSEDRTQEIAKEMGAEVYFHEFETHAKQRNWAIDNLNIDTKWILRIDADERFTEESCKELESLLEEHKDDDVNGISMSADLYFMGKFLKHGAKTRKRKIMLFKTGIGRIEDRRMDEHTVLSHGVSIHAKEKFIHYDFKDLDTYVRKLNWYASKEMQDYFEYLNSNEQLGDKTLAKVRKKKFGFYYKLPSFLRCWIFFLFMYVIKGNFLNGVEGYIYTYLYTFYYRTLVDAKILEQKMTNKPFEEITSLK